MKTKHWICYIAIIMLAWWLLDIGFGMDRYTKFPSWQWHLGFVLRMPASSCYCCLANL